MQSVRPKVKHIFITGGVVSSLGKGITAASLALLLERRGFRVALQKIDPYLNVDPGTMSPYQHGEVYILGDGTETDLDLGHYERFCDARLDARSSLSMGRIYQRVIERERQGDYLGKTVQTIPHVTNEIKASIRSMTHVGFGEKRVDIVITEIGGTVGDIEALPVLEAARQMAHEVGWSDCLFIHLTLIPYLKAAGEAKTKPTQHSVGQLRQIGIQPDFIICRSEWPMLSESDLGKIALFCNVSKNCVLELPDGDSIYDVPGMLAARNLDAFLCDRLELTECLPLDIADWQDFAAARQSLRHDGTKVVIAIVGKYVSHSDAYKSVLESLSHAACRLGIALQIDTFDAEQLTDDGVAESLAGCDGILVPGGFGERGVLGKIAACRLARETKIPFFGICLGMQVMVMEFARNVLGWSRADSTEFSPQTPYPVIDLMESQRDIRSKGGTMRLGSYPMECLAGTRVEQAYGVAGIVSERHRHRYEFNNIYREEIEQGGKGLIVSAISPCRRLVEAVEIADHPWFVGVQCHPEMQSRPTDPHPLFLGFLKAAQDAVLAETIRGEVPCHGDL